MAYESFAFWYDALNSDANYDALADRVVDILKKHGISSGIVADLGCGTGELTLRLAAAGYDMIGIDASADMLGQFRNKVHGVSPQPLLLCQQLENLDLYGTINAAVSTFDTLNHLSPVQLQQALKRIALFLESGGVFIFDVNTPYKHEKVLANNTFEAVSPTNSELYCEWNCHYLPAENSTQIELRIYNDNMLVAQEEFFEYSYSYQILCDMLAACGMQVQSALDGDSFSQLSAKSQRMFIVASKI